MPSEVENAWCNDMPKSNKANKTSVVDHNWAYPLPGHALCDTTVYLTKQQSVTVSPCLPRFRYQEMKKCCPEFFFLRLVNNVEGSLWMKAFRGRSSINGILITVRIFPCKDRNLNISVALRLWKEEKKNPHLWARKSMQFDSTLTLQVSTTLLSPYEILTLFYFKFVLPKRQSMPTLSASNLCGVKRRGSWGTEYALGLAKHRNSYKNS